MNGRFIVAALHFGPEVVVFFFLNIVLLTVRIRQSLYAPVLQTSVVQLFLQIRKIHPL